MEIRLTFSAYQRSCVKRLDLSAVIGCLVVLWSVREVVAQRGTPFTITRLYTGVDGQSHMEKIALKLRPSTLSAGLDESEPLKVSGARFLRWPPGYVYDWHPANQRQYALPSAVIA